VPSASSPALAERARSVLHLDLKVPHREPTVVRLLVATVLAVGLSLLADAALVAIGIHLFPSTKGYGHFQFHDYAKLTIIGVVIACAAWPAVTRVSPTPRWLFFRLAIAVTVVLLLPDVYILHQGQPAKAVAILMLMHLAIAVITYNARVHVAPPQRQRRRDLGRADDLR
jgi:hypothetical protein